MIDAERPGPRRSEPGGRPVGGTGHIFTLYVASQEPSPPADDGAPVDQVTSLGFLRSDEDGPSGP